ncbi:MAG: alpha/beta hydrolase [Actinomycetota bacterium]
MPAVLVHGNPETAAIWGPLIDALDRSDVITLSPPGFGAPVPDGWGATRAEYVAWLIGELEAIGEPVDLVGHDWGGGHVAAVAMTRPNLLRSWCVDVMGLFHPDYVWHDMAQVWQADGAGEEAVAAMIAPPLAERAAGFEGLGMPPEVALSVAEATNENMARCILALYRDAAQPAVREAGEAVPAAAARPGLVIVARDDPYVGTEEMAREMAERCDATVVALDGVGHWWMLQQPAVGAAALQGFWTGLGA